MSLSTSVTSPSSLSKMTFLAVFSEPISSALQASDVQAVDGIVQQVVQSSPTEFVFEVYPNFVEGTVDVSIPTGAIKDLNANPLVPSKTVSIIIGTSNHLQIHTITFEYALILLLHFRQSTTCGRVANN